MAFFDERPYYREADLTEFLRAFFLIRYGPPDAARTREKLLFADIRHALCQDFDGHGSLIPTFTGWLQRCAKLPESGLQSLPEQERTDFLACTDTLKKVRTDREDRNGRRKNHDGTVGLKIGATWLTVTPPRGYVVMNDEHSVYDYGLKVYTTDLNSKEMLTLGSEEDLRILLSDKDPPMAREIEVTENIDPVLPERITDAYFAEEKRRLVAEIKSADASEKIKTNGNERAAKSAAILAGPSVKELKLSGVDSLGVFQQDEHSVSYSAILKTSAKVEGETVNKARVSSLAVIHVSAKIVLVLATADYHGEEDVRWTQDAASTIRKQLLQQP